MLLTYLSRFWPHLPFHSSRVHLCTYLHPTLRFQFSITVVFERDIVKWPSFFNFTNQLLNIKHFCAKRLPSDLTSFLTLGTAWATAGSKCRVFNARVVWLVFLPLAFTMPHAVLKMPSVLLTPPNAAAETPMYSAPLYYTGSVKRSSRRCYKHCLFNARVVWP